MLLTTAQMHEDAIDAYYERFATGDDLFVYPCMRLINHVAFYQVIDTTTARDEYEPYSVYVDPASGGASCNCWRSRQMHLPCAHMGAVFLHRIAQNYSDL